jgi:hypothetical protein
LGNWSGIGAGLRNVASGTGSFIGGGFENVATGEYSVTGGGGNHLSSGYTSTIAGGNHHIASGYGSSIGGGWYNRAIGDYSVVGGGGGGSFSDSNAAAGLASCVPGGRRNSAQGAFSLAAGFRAKATHHGSFVWGDSAAEDVSSDASNQFKIRASNGMRLAVDAGSAKTIAIGDNYRDNSVVAWGNVGAGGVVESDFGITSVVKGATGVYTINIDAVAIHPSYLGVVASPEIDGIPTSAATARLLAIDQVDTNTFNVYITDGAWAGVDNEFTFIVMAR